MLPFALIALVIVWRIAIAIAPPALKVFDFTPMLAVLLFFGARVRNKWAWLGAVAKLAAIIDLINETKYYHVVTIEDPIEFTHQHKNSTIHQRELHSDTPSFALALRAALRQAPKVILVGEMRDRETMEVRS